MSETRETQIASLLVHGLPAVLGRVASAIDDLDGAEVHAEDPAGKLVVTLECAREAELLRLIGEIQDLDGVLAAVMVYHEVVLPDADPNIRQQRR